ncbi:hypothetical protein GQ53DRAFT_28282 [Thozetella sp. PMI_491]|nr:hypothetical protein GQ53DRAFT_28282 [Thozetella sp. PMI_491]
MPSRKSATRLTSHTHHGSLSEPENARAFIDFLRGLPQTQDHSDGDEPAAKRTKVAGAAICIAREEYALRFQKPSLGGDWSFVRKNVGEAATLRFKPQSSSGHAESPAQTNSGWDLQIMPRAKSHKPHFRVSREVAKHELSTKTAAALCLAESQGFDPGEHGHVWASSDAKVSEHDTGITVTLVIQVMWSESLGVSLFSHPAAQQKRLRAKILETWFPAFRLAAATGDESSCTPQDFYGAAHIPDKAAYDSQTSSITIPQLAAKLYPFQRRAVQWMLQREGVHWVEGSGDERVVPYHHPTERLPMSFVEARDVDGVSFGLSPLFGVVARDPSRYQPQLKGGILAEEMGLGKTLEIIALILLHQRPRIESGLAVDPYLGRTVQLSSATLIVTPSTLLRQWLSELNKHAPHLYVLHYEGMKIATEKNQSPETIALYDVVVTTYDVLKSEVHAALEPPDRSRRNARQYERPKSPLAEISWWRICVDEAQMVENATSNAAILARILPRTNAWGITGTPVKDDTQKDLRGLLSFLRFEPYASDPHIWKHISTRDKDLFRRLFDLISMRHTKSLVRAEIAIPPQRRYVITMPFTAVEEQHYQSLFKELAETCGLDPEGNPLKDDWNLEDPAVQNAMRITLDRLRQTALHPEIGARNRRALGRKSGPMRTVAEVLTAMIEQSENAVRVDERAYATWLLVQGQVMAAKGNANEARELWETARKDAEDLVAQSRKELAKEIQEAKQAGRARESHTDHDGSAEESDSDEALSPRVGEARRRLRYALEIQHKAVFFCGNAYFSIKSNEEVTAPDSEQFKLLEKMETESYDNAQLIRKEILQESYGKAKHLMDRIRAAASTQSFAEIPDLKVMDQKGLESRSIVDAFDELSARLDEQANQLDVWRESAIQLLLKPLVDDDKDAEITGEEYEESTKLQEEIEVYVEVLRAAVADRLAALTGQRNALVEHNAKNLVRMAGDEEGPFPQKLLELFEIRDDIKPPMVEGDPLTSLKGIISELRTLVVKLRHDAALGSTRASTEVTIAMNQLQLAQKQLSEQTKVTTQLEQEAEKFMDTLNARLEFYRQLQTVSDMVAEYTGASDDAELKMVKEQLDAARARIATGKAKHRYLMHLQEADSSTTAEQRMCIICQSPFSIGVLTVCGHQFCKECISLWFRMHRNCPVCKRKLTKESLHDITLKPKELRIHSETSVAVPGAMGQPNTSPIQNKSTIYTEFNPEKLAEIQNIDLAGPNYTTKVDTLVRHLLWLRESDPGAKSIVFSQYREFLLVLATAFKRYRIGYTSFEISSSVSSFRDDPGTEVFLLHARAHASGLNLVNASHVFLCEPLLNTALELQAIARVDRIGQEQETTVWLYIVDGTVEQSIYNLSVQRRMEHMGRGSKGKSKESTPEPLDARLDEANTMELQQAHLSKLMGKHGISGEAVDKNDLWSCLFGNTSKVGRDEGPPQNPAVRGLLAATAAEARMRGDK